MPPSAADTEMEPEPADLEPSEPGRVVWFRHSLSRTRMRTSGVPSRAQSATSHSYKEEPYDPVSFPRVDERKKLYRDRSPMALPPVDVPASGSSPRTPAARIPTGTVHLCNSFASHVDFLR